EPYIRLSYAEAVDILRASGKAFEFPVQFGVDLQTEHERFLCEVHFKKPVIVYNYPKEIKAFYMRLNDDEKTVAAMDLLVPRVGELVGGSQREERHDVLIRRMIESGLNPKDYWWYLDIRKFGTVPHSGFGLGFERFLMMATGITNIRDVIPFPRTPKNLDF
ncbi:MAG: amino acid--tRNA ligase-related protein, partial [Thermodesulfobacteriota bacterium]